MALGLGRPQPHERVDLLRMLGGEVARLGAVLVDVVERPRIGVEVPEMPGWEPGGDDLPPVVPEPAVPVIS